MLALLVGRRRGAFNKVLSTTAELTLRHVRVINLGGIYPAIFVLDCLPNMNGAMVKERVEPFVDRLRQSHPETPILLVEDRNYANSFFFEGRARTNKGNQAELRAAYDRIQGRGVKGLHYLAGERLLGEDGEDTVDGSHPTDLGFMRQAEAFLEVLGTIK